METLVYIEKVIEEFISEGSIGRFIDLSLFTHKILLKREKSAIKIKI